MACARSAGCRPSSRPRRAGRRARAAAATAAGPKAGSLTSPTKAVTASGRAASLAVVARPSAERSAASTVAPPPPAGGRWPGRCPTPPPSPAPRVPRTVAWAETRTCSSSVRLAEPSVAPEADDRGLAGRARAACRPRPTGARRRGRSRWRRRRCGCRAAPTRWAPGGRPAACCRGCCRRPAAPERLADAERHVVAEDGQRGGRHLEHLGHAGPQRRPAAGLRRPGQLVESRARRPAARRGGP